MAGTFSSPREADAPILRGLYVGTLNEETRHQLLRLESNAHYVAPGYLVFLDGDTLLAQSFDSDRLDLSGQPTPLGARIGRSSRGNGAFSTSRTGTLAYAGATLRTGRLTWFDRNGTALTPWGPTRSTTTRTFGYRGTIHAWWHRWSIRS